MLQLEFDGCRLPDGTALDCNVSLQGVDNAREKVSENRIDGVLAASHPSSWLSGLWFRPATFADFTLGLGLTGAAGTDLHTLCAHSFGGNGGYYLAIAALPHA